MGEIITEVKDVLGGMLGAGVRRHDDDSVLFGRKGLWCLEDLAFGNCERKSGDSK